MSQVEIAVYEEILQTGQQTVTALAPAAAVPTDPKGGRRSLVVVNTDATNPVYWGRTSAVNDSTGVPLYGRAEFTFPLGAGSQVYFYSPAGSPVLAFAEFGKSYGVND